MPRRPNAHRSARLTVRVTPQIVAYIKRLMGRGLYGKTDTEVAANMLARGIESVIERGHLDHPESKARNSRT